MAHRTRLPSSPLLLLTLLAACGGGTVEIKDSNDPGKDPPDDTGEVLDTDPGPVDTGCDTGTLRSWFRDADADGYGDPDQETVACAPPTGFIAESGDCDDTDPAVSPAATELCNTLDDDCDMVVDEGFDADGDGHESSECALGDDCDDTDATVNPEAIDACGDGVDADCDGADSRCGYETDLGAADAMLYADSAGDDLGRHMDLGDLDGDGNEDVAVGAMWANSYTGATWVAYGPISGTNVVDDVAWEVKGGTSGYESGRTIGIRDVTGDGYDDLFIGSPDASGYDAVIVFGPIDADTNFNNADVQTHCSSAIECGHGGDLADIDGDGVGDAIIGAGEQGTGGYYSGSAYIMYGPFTTEKGDLTSIADYELIGENASSETGRVISAGGDVDGDGVEDILITASYDSEGGPYAGAVHVVLGPVTDDMDLGDSPGKLLGNGAYEYAGEALAMGDVDGDGRAEAIVGAYQGARAAGVAYAVSDPDDGTMSLGSADYTLTGSTGEGLAISLASRDTDGDGIDEVFAGAATNNDAGASAGAAYLFYGPLAAELDSSDAEIQLLGESTRDAAGTGVGLGDLDGDGVMELLVGATGDATGASNAGALFIVYAGS